MLGFSPSVALSVVFLPYFGWKKIILINMVIVAFSIVFSIPYLLGTQTEIVSAYSGLIKIARRELGKYHHFHIFKHGVAEEKVAFPSSVSTLISFLASPLYIPAVCGMAFLARLGVMFSMYRLLKRRHFYDYHVW
jgi:hypothetical protein